MTWILVAFGVGFLAGAVGAVLAVKVGLINPAKADAKTLT